MFLAHVVTMPLAILPVAKEALAALEKLACLSVLTIQPLRRAIIFTYGAIDARLSFKDV
jgi:hypothetical protein